MINAGLSRITASSQIAASPLPCRRQYTITNHKAAGKKISTSEDKTVHLISNFLQHVAAKKEPSNQPSLESKLTASEVQNDPRSIINYK